MSKILNRFYKKTIFISVLLPFFICNVSWSSNKPILTLQNDDPISALAFSSDGSKIIVGWKNSYIWDLKTGENILTIPSNAASCAAFSPDGSMVATGTNPLSAAVWSAKTGEKIQTFKGKDDPYFGPETITAIAFHPTKPIVITGTQSGNISEWDISTGKETSIINTHELIDTISRLSDDNRIATRHHIIDLSSKSIIQQFEGNIFLKPNSNVFYYSISEGGSYQNLLFSLWNLDTYKKIKDFNKIVHDNKSYTFSPYNELLFIYDHRFDEAKTSYLGYVTCVSQPSIQQNYQFSGYPSLPCFSPDGTQLCIVVDQTIYIYDVSDLTSVVKDAEALGR